MTTKLETLSQRSAIPSAVSIYGYALPRNIQKQIAYDGQLLPSFLLRSKANPNDYRQFLKLNRIGSVFTLEAGRTVVIPYKSSTFPKHPEA